MASYYLRIGLSVLPLVFFTRAGFAVEVGTPEEYDNADAQYEQQQQYLQQQNQNSGTNTNGYGWRPGDSPPASEDDIIDDSFNKGDHKTVTTKKFKKDDVTATQEGGGTKGSLGTSGTNSNASDCSPGRGLCPTKPSTTKSLGDQSGNTGSGGGSTATSTTSTTTGGSPSSTTTTTTTKTTTQSQPKQVDEVAGMRKCDADLAKMQKACDSENSPDMKIAMKLADQLASGLAVSTGTSIPAACSSIGGMSTTVNAALAAYKGYCYAAIKECESSCTEDKTGENKRPECVKGKDTLAGIDMNVTSIVATAKNARQCSAYFAQYNCQVNPYAPNCPMDAYNCSSPAGANNPVCRCLNNANDPSCANMLGKIQGFNPGSNAPLDTANLSSLGNSSADYNTGLGMAEDPIAMQHDPSGGGKGPQGGGGRQVSASTSDPSRGGGGGGGGGPQGSSLNTKVLAGSYGGSGGGGGWGSSGGSSGSSTPSYTYQGQRVAAVDLKKFLPGGANDPRRRPAEVVGPDGITGPMSDIFAKINNRYAAVGHTLKP